MTTTLKNRIIGLVGPTQAGKSSAARVLMNTYGYRCAPMAGPLKQMLMTGGLSHDDVYGARKETPNAILGGQTPRHAMQTLGTEWGRELIHSDLWVNMWLTAYDRVVQNATPALPQPIVADDVRFENEVQAIRDLGGIIIEVCRPGAAYSTTHKSEKGVGVIDYRIHNTGDKAFLRSQVMDIIEGREPRV